MEQRIMTVWENIQTTDKASTAQRHTLYTLGASRYLTHKLTKRQASVAIKLLIAMKNILTEMEEK